MSNYSDIIAAVKARLETVTNVGVVHNHNRWNADWSTYLNQFKQTIGGTVQIRGWMVTKEESNPIVGDTYSMGNVRRTYNLLIYGVMGLDDSANTEQTFLNLVEAVMDTLDNRIDLGLAAVVDYGVGPSTLRNYSIRQFGSVLCNYAEIHLSVEVEKAVSFA